MRGPSHLRKGIGRFGRSSRGSAAVEFAILAAPFMLIVYAILEVALLFAAELVLDKGTEFAGRMVRTGQVQQSALTKEQFKALTCEKVSILLKCDDLVFDLRTYASFADVPTSIPMRGNSIDTSGFTYDFGRGGTIVALRVFYKWPIITGSMRQFFSKTSDGATMLMSLSTFRTEPF